MFIWVEDGWEVRSIVVGHGENGEVIELQVLSYLSALDK
jgi:hypothetical protein